MTDSNDTANFSQPAGRAVPKALAGGEAAKTATKSERTSAQLGETKKGMMSSRMGDNSSTLTRNPTEVNPIRHKKLSNQLKLVNGRYQYPIKGRQLPHPDHFNDLIYDTKPTVVQKQTPRVIIGKSKKFFDLQRKELHARQYGPATYTPKESITRRQVPSIAFSKDKKECIKKQLTLGQTEKQVGPGRYQQSTVSSNLKNNKPKGGYISREKKFRMYDNRNPAPGQYNPKTTLIKSQETSVSITRANINDNCRGEVVPIGNMGQVNMNSIRGSDLGPGQYNYSTSKLHGTPLKDLHQGYKFGRNPKMVRSHSSQIGPGEYQTHNFKNNSKFGRTELMGAFTRSGMSSDRLQSDMLGVHMGQSPEPSKYQKDVSKFKMTDSCFKFDRSPKTTLERVHSPGPGHYLVKDDIQQVSSKSRKFTKSTRNFDQYLTKNLDTTPSPGQYEWNEKNKKRFVTHKFPQYKQKREEDYNFNPGPGSYNPKKAEVNQRSAQIVMDEVDRLVMKLNQKLKPKHKRNMTSKMTSQKNLSKLTNDTSMKKAMASDSKAYRTKQDSRNNQPHQLQNNLGGGHHRYTKTMGRGDSNNQFTTAGTGLGFGFESPAHQIEFYGRDEALSSAEEKKAHNKIIQQPANKVNKAQSEDQMSVQE